MFKQEFKKKESVKNEQILTRFIKIVNIANPLQVYIPSEFTDGSEGEIYLSVREFGCNNPTSLQNGGAVNPDFITLSAPQVAFTYDENTKGSGIFYFVNYQFENINSYYYQQTMLDEFVSIGQMANEITISFNDPIGNPIQFNNPYFLSIKMKK